MDNAALVRIRGGRNDLTRDLQRLGNRKLLLTLEQLLQRLAGDVRHHIVGHTVSHARPEYFRYLWMVELRRKSDLTQKPLDYNRAAKLVTKNLYCDLFSVTRVRAEIDGGHPAAAELPLDPVMLCDYARGS